MIDTVDADLIGWAGQTGTLYVSVFNTGSEDIGATIVWDLLKIAFE